MLSAFILTKRCGVLFMAEIVVPFVCEGEMTFLWTREYHAESHVGK